MTGHVNDTTARGVFLARRFDDLCCVGKLAETTAVRSGEEVTSAAVRQRAACRELRGRVCWLVPQ